MIQVVPKVLQGFLVRPQIPLFNMPSQRLSTVSVGFIKAVWTMSPVHSTLWSIRPRSPAPPGMTCSSLHSERSDSHQLDVLRINSFAPVLLSEISTEMAEPPSI